MKIPSFLIPLLWDVDSKTLRKIQHKSFMITRIAEKGTIRAVMWLRKTYTLRDIKKIVARSNNVSDKTKNYWRLI